MSRTSLTSSRWWHVQHRAAPYLFLSPFIALFAVFIVYPLLRSLALSFYKTVGPGMSSFAGLDNYRFVLTDRYFWLATLNTLLYTIGFLVLQVPLSLGLALLLNRGWVRWRSAYRFAFFSTHLVGFVFAAVLFAQLLSPRSGLVNRAIGAIVGESVQINWLGDPRLALPAVLLAGVWLSVGFGMIYLLAALQSVDRQLYEAAQVDGASKWSQFWHVTLPGIRPVLVFLVLIGTISAFQLFELPWVLFQQAAGPSSSGLTIVMYLFQMGFTVGDLGLASAVGWIFVAMILAISLLQLRASGVTREL